MTDVMIDLKRPVTSMVPADMPELSDEQCLERLALAVANHDADRLAEVVRLIGRLVATIE